MFSDPLGEPVDPSIVVGQTIQSPAAALSTHAFVVDASIDSAIKSLLADAGDGHGAATLTARVEGDRIVLGVLVGHRFGDNLKVAGWGEWSPDRGAEAGVTGKINWAP